MNIETFVEQCESMKAVQHSNSPGSVMFLKSIWMGYEYPSIHAPKEHNTVKDAANLGRQIRLDHRGDIDGR